MDLDKALGNLKYDKRMLDWYLNQGLMTKEEHEQFLQKLPDLSERAEKLNFEGEDTGED